MISNRFIRRRASVAMMLLIAALAFSAPAWLGSAAAQEKQDCPVRVTLLQVNDVYQFTPVDGGKTGGLARVLTKRKEIMSKSPHTLFLMAGDTISPSIESNTHKGKQMIEAWNLAGLDFAALGNHEFDFGPETLRQRIVESRFTWLAANVFDKKTGKLFADTPEFVVRKFDGVNVGFFGLLLPETLKTSKTEGAVDITDPCATAARVIPKIRAAGAQVIVALTHLSMAEDKELARCSGVDVIIGGHEHNLLQSMAGHAPIFKMTSDAREMGRIDLNISRATGKLESIDWEIIRIDEGISPDIAFAPLNEKYGALLSDLEQVVGRTEVKLDLRSGDLRTRETNMANFIADVYREATSADVAIVNGGSIRADAEFNPGVLTRRDVLSMLPYNNRIVKIQVTGAVLRAALEYGVESIGVERYPGRFPQVSGIRFAYDAGREPGKRLTNVTVNGKPLENRQTYTLATSEYVALHEGDGYKVFTGAKVLIGPDKGPAEADVLIKAIGAVTSIAPKVDGRITRVDAGKETGVCK